MFADRRLGVDWLRMAHRVRLGELLVDAKVISREQLEQVLERQKTDPRRLGTLLVESGLVTETQVTQLLSQQLSVPWVSLYHVDFSRQLLDLVPQELAEKYCLVPIFVRRIRGLGNTLYVAMDDPTNEAAVSALTAYSGLPIRTMIAPPSDIAAALSAYYGRGRGLTPSMAPRERSSVTTVVAQRAGPPASAEMAPPIAQSEVVAPVLPEREMKKGPPPQPVRRRDAGEPAVTGAAGIAGPSATVSASADEAPSESAREVDVREPSMPVPRRGVARKMVTLTLLDGSKITLPARTRKAAPSSSEQVASQDADHLTTRDLLQALRARVHGQDTSEVLGDHGRWEVLMVALLEVLLKKHIVADWEFIEELKRL